MHPTPSVDQLYHIVASQVWRDASLPLANRDDGTYVGSTYMYYLISCWTENPVKTVSHFAHRKWALNGRGGPSQIARRRLPNIKSHRSLHRPNCLPILANLYLMFSFQYIHFHKIRLFHFQHPQSESDWSKCLTVYCVSSRLRIVHLHVYRDVTIVDARHIRLLGR